MSAVLVVNATYEPIHRVSLQHALKMLFREVAVVEEAEDGREIGPFPFPKVLRLVRYVKLRWQHRVPSWSRARLLERDGHRCAYCGRYADTVDHIVPISHGGKSTWLNTVAACGGPKGCNARKRNRSPVQAGMEIRFASPHVPDWWELTSSSPFRAGIPAAG